MAPRTFVILSDKDEFEPEVTHAMRVPRLHVPGKEEFRGMITADEIADLAKRDQKTILKMSVMEQWNDWQTDQLVALFGYVRQLEAEIIRQRIQAAKLKDEQKTQGFKWGFLKWLGMALAAGLFAALFRSFFGKGP